MPSRAAHAKEKSSKEGQDRSGGFTFPESKRFGGKGGTQFALLSYADIFAKNMEKKRR